LKLKSSKRKKQVATMVALALCTTTYFTAPGIGHAQSNVGTAEAPITPTHYLTNYDANTTADPSGEYIFLAQSYNDLVGNAFALKSYTVLGFEGLAGIAGISGPGANIDVYGIYNTKANHLTVSFSDNQNLIAEGGVAGALVNGTITGSSGSVGGDGGNAEMKAIDLSNGANSKIIGAGLTVSAIGAAGGAGGNGAAGADGTDGSNGTSSIAAASPGSPGVAGGSGGAGGDGGIGGNATASALKLATMKTTSVVLDSINVTAQAGNGGQGGNGGNGGQGGDGGGGGSSNGGAGGGNGGNAGNGGTPGTAGQAGIGGNAIAYGVQADASSIKMTVETMAVTATGGDGGNGGSGSYGLGGSGGSGGSSVWWNGSTWVSSGTQGTSGNNGSTYISPSTDGVDGGTAEAHGLELTKQSTMNLQVDAITVTAQAGNAGIGVSLTPYLSASSDGDNGATATATAISVADSVLNVTSASGGAITITATATNGLANNSTALVTDHSIVTFDSGVNNTTFTGYVTLTTDSSLSLLSDTVIHSNISANDGVLTMDNSSTNLGGNLIVSENMTMGNASTLYVGDHRRYVLNNQYKDTAYHAVVVNGDLTSDNTLNQIWMRTDAIHSAGDAIAVTDTVSGTYNFHIFDQAMRTGGMWSDVTGQVLMQATTLNSAGADVGALTTTYDNTVWNYTYTPTVVVNGANAVVVTDLGTPTFELSSTPKTAQDSHIAAVSIFRVENNSLMKRLGDLRQNPSDSGIWARYQHGSLDVNTDRSGNQKYDGIQGGYDKALNSNWHAGFAIGRLESTNTYKYGTGESNSNNVALYGTYMGEKGHYADIIIKGSRIDNKFSAYGGANGGLTTLQTINGDYDNNGTSFSAEYGYRKNLDNGWFIEPQVEASYGHLNSTSYTADTADGWMDASNNSVTSKVLRAGFLAGTKTAHNSSFYIKASVLHDFDSDVVTNISGDNKTRTLSDSLGGTYYEYGLGLNHTLNVNSNLYLDLERTSGGTVNKDWGINIGLRHKF